VEVTIQGSWNGNNIDSVTLGSSTIIAILTQPLIIGGKTVLDAHTGFNLKGRIIGQDDSRVRPDLVQIGLSIDEVKTDRLDAQGQPHCPCDRYADLTSNELVFTVSYVGNAYKPSLRFDTKLRFTIGGTGSVEVSTGPTPAPARPGPALEIKRRLYRPGESSGSQHAAKPGAPHISAEPPDGRAPALGGR
jgi:hypothetical protein